MSVPKNNSKPDKNLKKQYSRVAQLLREGEVPKSVILDELLNQAWPRDKAEKFIVKVENELLYKDKEYSLKSALNQLGGIRIIVYIHAVIIGILGIVWIVGLISTIADNIGNIDWNKFVPLIVAIVPLAGYSFFIIKTLQGIQSRKRYTIYTTRAVLVLTSVTLILGTGLIVGAFIHFLILRKYYGVLDSNEVRHYFNHPMIIDKEIHV